MGRGPTRDPPPHSIPLGGPLNSTPVGEPLAPPRDPMGRARPLRGVSVSWLSLKEGRTTFFFSANWQGQVSQSTFAKPSQPDSK